jgi:glycosyltransferase involved in cell wall biosynthesis
MARDFSRNPLRVLHVAKWYPNRNDVQNGVFIQKHIQATSRFAEVKVLAWLPGGKKTETLESHENGLAVTRTWFKQKTPVSVKRHVFREYISSHYNNKNLPDLIHLHIFSPDLLLPVYWAKKKNIPVVISEHWSGYMTGVFNQLPYWRKWSYNRLGKVNRILPVSNYLMTNMQKVGIKGSYQVVPNVVESNTATTEKLPGYHFVMVSDLVDRIKNISGVIAAFEKASAIQPLLKLHLIGGGPDEDLIAQIVEKSSAKEAIKRYGRLANEEVTALLPSFNCLVVNSRVESFGVVLLEAHAAGLPVITTTCGGPEEWLEKGDVAIPVDDEHALQNAMVEMSERKANVQFKKWKSCLPNEVGRQLNEIYQAVHAENQSALALRNTRKRKKRVKKQ